MNRMFSLALWLPLLLMPGAAFGQFQGPASPYASSTNAAGGGGGSLTCSGCSAGQVLIWNGTGLAPSKLTLTQPATGSTLTVVDGKTLTSSNTLTLAGTDGSTLNVGSGGTLGSNAFTSTAYLPLAGGTLTGPITGTSNIVEQRNGNNGQILRVGYNFTDASNFSWGMIDAGQTTANTVYLGSRSTGSPAQKLTKLVVAVDGTNQLDYGVTNGSTWTTAGNFYVGNIARAAYGYSINGTAYLRSVSGDGTIRLTNNAENDFGRLQFGGTTSSFPALKRSSATLQFRLADDSADAAFQASTATLTSVASDATHTDATVCRDTTTGLLLAGSGAAGICLGTSSIRYKHDIQPLRLGLAQIVALKPVSYRYNADHGDPNKKLYGFTAEQVADVMPELVGRDAEGRPNSVDWAGIVPVLVKAVQELKEQRQ